jgi:RHS repeat-associated protein
VTTKEGGLAHPIYRYTYDGLNRRTSMEDPSGNKTQYTYTMRGEPASTLYPDGTSEVYSYDSEGSLHRKTTPDGRLIAYNYDFLGRLIGVETFSQAKTGPGEFLGMCHYKYNTFHLVEVKDDQNYETRAKYNSAGILECLEGHYGWKEGEEPPKTVFEYDAFGSESGHKEWFGSGEDDYIHTSFRTDASGHITDKTVSDSNGKILSQIAYSYDSSGNRTQTAVQGEQVELIEYNEFNEPTKLIDSQGRISTFLYNHHDIDAEGQRVFTKTTIDPCGSQKIQKYDLRGLLVSQLSQTASGLLLEKEKYVYDLQQNLCEKITFTVLEGSIQGQQTTLYTYDTMNRPLSIDIEGKKTTFEYDKFGLISKKYEPDYSDPIRYSYRYGLHQLLTTITYPLLDNSEASNSPYYSFNQVLLKFNSSGGLIRTTTTIDNATVERKLGFKNQVLEETISCDKTQEYTVKTSFDRMGRTKAITLPDSSSIQYRYESSFLREITRTNGYGIAQYTHNYVDYDQLGNITREECIGNTGDRLSQWAAGKQKRSIITDFYKEFIEQDGVDLLGNVLALHAETPQGESSSSFTYDPLSRLLSEQGLFSHTYTCDSLGNHRSIDGAFQSVDSFNRLLASGAIINTYDRRGCLRSKATPSGTTNLRYDIFNRLLSVASGGKSARFSYDGLGRRIAQKVELNGKETFLLFLYFNGEEIGRINSEGAIDQLKIPGLESPVAFELHKRTVAPIYDLHSNVVALIDPDTREVLESYAYSAFGEEQIFDQDNEELSRSSLDNPWRFAGKRKEAISGLILFEKRAYDPSLRCWTSPDPAGEVDGPNLYLFSRGNPLIFGDPLGLSSQSHYTHYENFETYMASERGTPCARGGELGLIEHSSEVRSQSQSGRNFVTLFSTKYSEEQIIEKLKSDPGFGRHVIGHINGMNTDYEAVLKRAKRMIESSNERIEAVLIAYNGTTGWIADTGEAIGNILRTNSQVAQDLQTGIMNFFDNFRDCKTDVRIAFHCHSQGAAIIDCILTTREFDRSNENGYAKFMGQTFTYGAATFLDLKKGEGINFWTPGDPIPLLNPRNYDIMESNPQCIKFTTFRIQHPFDAHAFESPAYQEAFQHAIEAQY